MSGLHFCIAIDGPAAAGKGTIARALADKFGFAHLDTGLLYRAVGKRHLEGVPPLQAAQKLQAEDLSDSTPLRRPEIARAASLVAAMPDVRAALVDFQRAFGQRAGGAVLDGRDIGTVICPDAQVKLFVTASVETRAERRYRELVERGLEADLAQVLADVQQRDARDRDRATAPMTAAADAIVLDTSDLTIAEAVARAVEHVQTTLTNAT